MLALLLLPLVDTPLDEVPEDNDVVAGWGAFALFGLLILAVVILGVSLTHRLKNVDRAAEAGLYDPSDEKRRRPARGLALARQVRQDEAAGPADDTPAG